VQSRRSRQSKRSPEELFGQVLRDFRKDSGLTQEELAFRSGYHSTYIGQLERGQKSPSLRALMNLSPVLGTAASELILRVERLQRELQVK
jgi:transcriptional regulator with XRE-family HTH domain